MSKNISFLGICSVVGMLLFITLCISLTSCSKDDSLSQDNIEEENNAPLSVSMKQFTFYKGDQTQWSFKVMFGEEVKITTSSSYFVVEDCNAIYKKKEGNSSSFYCFFTAYTSIGGNKIGVWNEYDLELTFLSANHGKFTGKQLDNPEDTDVESISGMFVYDSDKGIDSFIQNGENGDENIQTNEVNFSNLTKSIWIASESSHVRFLSFDNQLNYKHYFKLQNSVHEESGKYIINETDKTLKLLDANGTKIFDFKVIKLSQSELWLGSYDAINKKYPSSPNIIMRPTVSSDDIPSFISGNNQVELNISSPVYENIDNKNATVKGTVLGENVKFEDRGVCYSTEKSPTVDDVFVSCNSNIISVTLSKLFSGTTYYVRLYAKINGKYYYGEESSFTTKGERVYKVIFKEVSEISNFTKSHIELTATLPNEIGKYGICYGKNPHPTVTDNFIAEANRKTKWTLPDLECGYDYYVRAYHIDGSIIIYYEDSEIKIRPVNNKQVEYLFKFDLSNYYVGSYSLSIKLIDWPAGVYSVEPVVWRYENAYYQESHGKNYDMPKKYIEKSDGAATVTFNGTITRPKTDTSLDYLNDYNYYLEEFSIIPVETNSTKTVQIKLSDEI